MPTPLIVLGIIVLFFVFLLSLKATITVGYAKDVTLSVKVLFLRIGILPKKDKKKGPHSMSAKKARKIREKAAKKKSAKAKAAKEKAAKKKEKLAQKHKKPKKSLSEILDIIGLVRELAAVVIRKFFKHLRIDVARLKIKVAMGDAANTAIAYGAISQAVNLLIPVLQEVKNFNLPDVVDFDIQADFLGDAIEADIELSFSIRVWHLFDIAFGALKTFIKRKLFKK